jgi:hypothetical protein
MLPIPTNPDKPTLSQFSEAWMFALGMLAAPMTLWRGYPTTSLILWLVAVLGRIVGLVRPQWLRWVFVGLMLITWPMGWVVSNLVLAIVYYGVLTPIGLLRRLRRPDPLGRKLDRSASTHWADVRPNTRQDRHFRQF